MDAGTAAADIGVIPGSAGTRLTERFIAGQNQTADPIDAIQRGAACPGRLTAGIKADILMGCGHAADTVVIHSRKVMVIILTDIRGINLGMPHSLISTFVVFIISLLGVVHPFGRIRNCKGEIFPMNYCSVHIGVNVITALTGRSLDILSIPQYLNANVITVRNQ